MKVRNTNCNTRHLYAYIFFFFDKLFVRTEIHIVRFYI